MQLEKFPSLRLASVFGAHARAARPAVGDAAEAPAAGERAEGDGGDRVHGSAGSRVLGVGPDEGAGQHSARQSGRHRESARPSGGVAEHAELGRADVVHERRDVGRKLRVRVALRRVAGLEPAGPVHQDEAGPFLQVTLQVTFAGAQNDGDEKGSAHRQAVQEHDSDFSFPFDLVTEHSTVR